MKALFERAASFWSDDSGVTAIEYALIGALIAVGGIYMALPKELILGPTWLLPILIGFLLVPTIFAPKAESL